jgi:hypothetical protein
VRSELAIWLERSLSDQAKVAPRLADLFGQAYNTLCKIQNETLCSDLTQDTPETRVWHIVNGYFKSLQGLMEVEK